MSLLTGAKGFCVALKCCPTNSRVDRTRRAEQNKLIVSVPTTVALPTNKAAAFNYRISRQSSAIRDISDEED